jgi:tripartite-type tricarboxylate transporter receptor subunit TctC
MKIILAVIASIICTPVLAQAKWEPKKPIIAYVGYAPGSGNEMSFRGVAAEIERTNPGVHFVVQNIPGADGMVSVNKSFKEAPDGYTLNATGDLITYVLNEVFYPEGIQWTVNDLYPVVGTAASPQCIITSPNSNIKDVTDFVKLIKNPNRNINVALGSYAQYMVYGMMMVGAQGDSNKVKNVMYRGPAQALQDVASGQLEVGIVPLSVAAQMINAGKVRLIGVSGDKRMPQYPKVQTVNEVLPGVVIMALWNITLPKGTPPEIVDWYVREFSKAVKSKNVQKYFDDNYMRASEYLTPQAQSKEIAELREKLLPIARKLKKDLAN